jgi:hypothetical protein
MVRQLKFSKETCVGWMCALPSHASCTIHRQRSHAHTQLLSHRAFLHMCALASPASCTAWAMSALHVQCAMCTHTHAHTQLFSLPAVLWLHGTVSDVTPPRAASLSPPPPLPHSLHAASSSAPVQRAGSLQPQQGTLDLAPHVQDMLRTFLAREAGTANSALGLLSQPMLLQLATSAQDASGGSLGNDVVPWPHLWALAFTCSSWARLPIQVCRPSIPTSIPPSLSSYCSVVWTVLYCNPLPPGPPSTSFPIPYPTPLSHPLPPAGNTNEVSPFQFWLDNRPPESPAFLLAPLSLSGALDTQFRVQVLQGANSAGQLQLSTWHCGRCSAPSLPTRLRA